MPWLLSPGSRSYLLRQFRVLWCPVELHPSSSVRIFPAFRDSPQNLPVGNGRNVTFRDFSQQCLLEGKEIHDLVIFFAFVGEFLLKSKENQFIASNVLNISAGYSRAWPGRLTQPGMENASSPVMHFRPMAM